MNKDYFRRTTAALWDLARMNESSLGVDEVTFARWSGATKDLLLAMGLEWDHERQQYRFKEDV